MTEMSLFVKKPETEVSVGTEIKMMLLILKPVADTHITGALRHVVISHPDALPLSRFLQVMNLIARHDDRFDKSKDEWVRLIHSDASLTLTERPNAENKRVEHVTVTPGTDKEALYYVMPMTMWAATESILSKTKSMTPNRFAAYVTGLKKKG